MMMETDAVRVIRAVTNTPVEIPEEKEEVNMCKAIEEMMEDSRQEGARKGKQEGIQEGIRKGKQEAVGVLAGLVRDGLLSRTEAADRLHMPEAEIEVQSGTLHAMPLIHPPKLRR